MLTGEEREKNKKGIVYLVGAGPGDPRLITVRGLECIARAEVLVYDRLVAPGLLRHAPQGCELINAGKRPGAHTLKQDEINDVLLSKAREGYIVTRLKGGDPFLFGRGGEEAEHLAEHGIPFEVVPGITSALSVPAYAGIPVTHRNFTSSLAIITGHENPEKEEDGVAWDKLSTGAGTLLLLMGRRNLAGITAKMIEYGRPPQTPAALISRGTLPRQRTLCAPLKDIAVQAEKELLPAPAVLVVGEVVQLRQKLAWLEQKPLFGCRIVITRPREQAGPFANAIADLGGDPLEFPMITIAPPEDYGPLDRAIAEMDSFDFVIFTSVNGVKNFWERLRQKERDIRDLKGARLCAIGPVTAASLEEKGLRVEIIPPVFRAEGLVEQLRHMIKPGDRVLLPRAAVARDLLPRALKEMGCSVTEVETYRTLPGEADGEMLRQLLQQGEVQVITFTSPSTVRECVNLLGEGALALLDGVTLASIGPVTTAEAHARGLKIDVEAEEYTIDGIIKGLLREVGQ